jgi:hypothetical protein
MRVATPAAWARWSLSRRRASAITASSSAATARAAAAAASPTARPAGADRRSPPGPTDHPAADAGRPLGGSGPARRPRRPARPAGPPRSHRRGRAARPHGPQVGGPQLARGQVVRVGRELPRQRAVRRRRPAEIARQLSRALPVGIGGRTAPARVEPARRGRRSCQRAGGPVGLPGLRQQRRGEPAPGRSRAPGTSAPPSRPPRPDQACGEVTVARTRSDRRVPACG